MTEEFQIGQRWYSYPEAELGLGVVRNLENRTIVMFFPATGDERIYALSNAPLSRIIYPVGDWVADDEGLSIRVTAHEYSSGCVIYQGLDEAGTEQFIHEASLVSSVHFSKPYERLFAGQIDKLSHYELRLETLKHQHNHQQSAAYGLLGPRVQCLPHQFYIASEVGQRIAPRVLLADEVGLGKTIEAGLILHQQLICGLASRVLVVVPDSLVLQWLVEMLRRFNLHFSILDKARCSETQMNPFEAVQLALCPLSLFTQEGPYLDQALSAGWDLMVVDEAHHLDWKQGQPSYAYQCIEALALQVKGVLLLTATPEQLGREGHFARLRLLDPDRYYDLQTFIAEEQGYQQVNQLIEILQDPESWQRAMTGGRLLTSLQPLLDGSYLEQLHSCMDADEYPPQNLVNEVIAALLDQHGTGRVLFRNTRDSVSGFPERKLFTYALDLPSEYSQAMAEVALEQRLHPEILIEGGKTAAWLAVDNRVDWLVNWLDAYRNDKILIICAHADTAITLEKQLRLFEGRRTALFHEGMSLLERDRAAAYFADTEEGAQLLICSEIGSEGRNFQFAHHLVMFDLPQNPDLLEQRIGRLDRIGQLRDVNIHVPYFSGSAQAVLLRWYAEGLSAFEQVCSTGQAIMYEYQNELLACMDKPSVQPEIEQLLTKTAGSQANLLAELQQGRNKLLELNSCNLPQAEQVLEAVAELSTSGDLASYMARVFDHFGVDHESTGVQGMVLHPSDHMLTEHFPNLPDEGLSATFQRSEALSREDMHYLTWEHPMVSGAMEMMLEGGYGSSAFCTMKLLPLKAGSLLVEAVFKAHCIAPRTLQLQRYLADACIRKVINSDGADLSDVITEKHFSALGKRVSKNMAFNLVKHARSDISDLCSKLEKQAAELEEDLFASAKLKIQQQYDQEKERLQALAKVNPNIRQEEIAAIELQAQQLLAAMESATLKMDAIRVAVVTHD